MKTHWEYDLVEKPFCEQLKGMGWDWLEGDTDVPELTERENFREVLLKGTVADGLADWEQGRPQSVRFIEFENPANNDFLVVNQFKVELTSGRGHVIPDAVLFVNGIPLVVAEFKSPGIQSPLQEAINQLLRYSNQRRELFPTLYTESEGVERLFHTNQLIIASDFFEARTATIEMVERIRQEIRKVGFWKNPTMRELLTRTLVRDLDEAGICRSGGERDLAQRLVALAKENHENLVRS